MFAILVSTFCVISNFCFKTDQIVPDQWNCFDSEKLKEQKEAPKKNERDQIIPREKK